MKYEIRASDWNFDAPTLELRVEFRSLARSPDLRETKAKLGRRVARTLSADRPTGRSNLSARPTDRSFGRPARPTGSRPGARIVRARRALHGRRAPPGPNCARHSIIGRRKGAQASERAGQRFQRRRRRQLFVGEFLLPLRAASCRLSLQWQQASEGRRRSERGRSRANSGPGACRSF